RNSFPEIAQDRIVVVAECLGGIPLGEKVIQVHDRGQACGSRRVPRPQTVADHDVALELARDLPNLLGQCPPAEQGLVETTAPEKSTGHERSERTEAGRTYSVHVAAQP